MSEQTKELLAYSLRIIAMLGATALGTAAALQRQGRPFQVDKPWWPQISSAFSQRPSQEKNQLPGVSTVTSPWMIPSTEIKPIKRTDIEGD